MMRTGGGGDVLHIFERTAVIATERQLLWISGHGWRWRQRGMGRGTEEGREG